MFEYVDKRLSHLIYIRAISIMISFLIIVLFSYDTFGQAIGQYKIDTVKTKKCDFTFESGIYFGSSPKSDYGKSRINPGIFLCSGVMFHLPHMFDINFGIGYYSGEFRYNTFYYPTFYDTINSQYTGIEKSKTTTVKYSKIFIPIKVHYRVFNFRNKHEFNIGIGLHKEVVLADKFVDYDPLENRTWKYNVMSSKHIFYRFFHEFKGSVYLQFILNYNFKISSSLKLGIEYVLFSNFHKNNKTYFGLNGGTSNVIGLTLVY